MSIVEQLKANVDKLNAVNFEGVAEKIKELKKELAESKSSTSSQVEKLNSEIGIYKEQLSALENINNSLKKSTDKLLLLQTSINTAINSDGRRKSRRKRSKKRKSRKRKL